MEEVRWLIFDCKQFFRKVKRVFWNKGLRIIWCRLWIRKDEFHHSLDMDIDAMSEMDDEEREKYIKDLTQRRKIAHELDLNREK